MTQPIADERGGWTSASNALSDSLCPGRYVACRGLTEIMQSEEAESGTAIHAAMAGKPVRALDADESTTAAMLADMERKATAAWKEAIQADAEAMPVVIRERRLWVGRQNDDGVWFRQAGRGPDPGA